MRLRGRLEELRKSVTNSKGKIPCTASPVPNRTASRIPRLANANAIRIDRANSTKAPPIPATNVTPNASPTSR
jgi:hypothetical protein